MWFTSTPEALATKALVLSVISGLSLPVGAALGIYLSPVDNKVCGRILAFGGGALLFAVTVSIYGHELSQFESGQMERYENWVGIIGGFAGSIFYLYVASFLEVDHDHHSYQLGDAEKALRGEIVPFARQETPPDQLSSIGRRRSISREALTMAEVDKERKEEVRQKEIQIAFSLFLGLLIDGIPEGIFMGFLAAQDHLGAALIVSLLIANFPEAFSSASLLERAGIGFWPIMSMWTGLCLLVGVLSGISCWGLLYIYPAYAHGHDLPKVEAAGVSFVEGFTGGAMLSCISAVMLPDAQERIGKGGPLTLSSGFLTTAGFLCSLAVELVYHRI